MATTRVFSYDEAQSLIKSARNKALGKPLTPYAYLRPDGDNFLLVSKENNRCAAVIYPDNTIEFLVDNIASRVPHAVKTIINSLTNFRVAIKRGGATELWAKHGLSTHEAFPGIKFDMRYEQCVNPKRTYSERSIRQRRLEWLELVKRTKRNLQARAKMGGFDELLQQAASGINDGSLHDIKAPRFFTAVTSGVFDAQFITDAVYSTRNTWWSTWNPTSADLLAAVDSLFTNNNYELREMFGVYSEE